MRETMLLKVEALLKERGFHVESFAHSNACFDLVAKRPDLTLVLKVFNNIDALREEHAAELRKIAALFNATVLVIGEKTKAFSLKKGVLYERLGIAAMSLGSLGGLLDEHFPSVKYFKGKSIVELDSKRLRERRKELGFTLQELADKIESTVESVHRYEKGASASLSTAEKLEDALSASLVTKINLFEEQALSRKKEKGLFEENFEDETLGKVHDLGVKVAVFRHAPFKACTSPGDSVLIGKVSAAQGMQKKAEELAHTKEALQGQPLIISREFKFRHVAEIPVIAEEELDTLSKFKDLMKLIKEREG
jgi:putative transcriptional regulator